jgi:exodeoxyribonuclease VII small subunit
MHMSKVKPTPPKDYESAVAELEKIVASMESGRLGLEDSLAAYQRGSELLAYCREQLSQAEQKVRILEEGVLKPFLNTSSDE